MAGPLYFLKRRPIKELQKGNFPCSGDLLRNSVGQQKSDEYFSTPPPPQKKKHIKKHPPSVDLGTRGLFFILQLRLSQGSSMGAL